MEDSRENLPFTGYECETLAQIYRVPPDRRLWGKSAKIDPYKTRLQDIQILHSSHHGKSNLNDPLASVLELADGNLTLAQLLTWRFPNLADAFISACETHLSRPEITDDILTIATGFLCAGARSVVSTLWSVEDFASALLALFYYENRFEGLSRPRALQQAQQRLRFLTGKELEETYKSELESYLQRRFEGDKDALGYRQHLLQRCFKEEFPFPHPYFWAGFMSQGLA
ncbi:MAG: CHAT domain-containing protein [Cyanobacteriota bacterium]|nr:CHAT domain-containing protein [Cyanobacteriota bacterium]